MRLCLKKMQPLTMISALNRHRQRRFARPSKWFARLTGIRRRYLPVPICCRPGSAAVRMLQAGGLPMEVPVMSAGEMFTKPTAMFHRNFLAMETEELLRANPLDGAVLLGGCDKSTPALLMGAFSMNLPSIYMPCGPMIRGLWRGETLASGSDDGFG